jgi:hypothetical protein
MWRPLSDKTVQLRENAAANKRTIPKYAAAILATTFFIVVLFVIAYFDQQFGLAAIQAKANRPYSLQSASAPALIAIFGVTVFYMYFLFVKNRRVPVVYVCYDCQEAFQAQTTCPACHSSRVADIRHAEWIE